MNETILLTNTVLSTSENEIVTSSNSPSRYSKILSQVQSVVTTRILPDTHTNFAEQNFHTCPGGEQVDPGAKFPKYAGESRRPRMNEESTHSRERKREREREQERNREREEGGSGNDPYNRALSRGSLSRSTE